MSAIIKQPGVTKSNMSTALIPKPMHFSTVLAPTDDQPVGYGTTIKDTWTKSRERMEVGEGEGFGWGGVGRKGTQL